MKGAVKADTILCNAKIYTKGRLMDGGIAIKNGKIAKIAKEPNLPSAFSRIDLNGCIALPGLIDVHVHLRDQGRAYEEDFFTGTAAAVSGGITSVMDMPNNTPVTMDSASLKERMQTAQQTILANVGFYAAFPERLEEIGRLIEQGTLAFKLYLTTQIGGVDINDDEALLQAFAEAEKFGIPTAVHAEDKAAIDAASAAEQRRGHSDVNAYLKAHTPDIEAKAVKRILKIIRKSKAQIHFCHISSRETEVLIRESRRTGLRVTCEATPHHLLLTSSDLRRQGMILLTDPPLRPEGTTEELWKAARSAQIDIIASDHAPHLITQKTADSVWDVKPGIPGLETLLPLLLTKINEGKMELHDLIRLLAENPAKIFHLRSEGFLEEGYNANITVVDMHRRGRIEADKFHSKAKFSPFDGWHVTGKPVKTFVEGRLVMDEGKIVAKAGTGRILRSQINV
ncbi:MAG: dihydroorotase family protein [Candidatus Bathyarchaeota archaeon]|nr:MAG: dihydroorotase family protein [Candidatus Bathyarchaeota archaeon]